MLQLIIFLYLLDNETSTVVLLSAGAGTAIEFWKVTKAMKVSIDWSRGFPLPKFEDKAGMHVRGIISTHFLHNLGQMLVVKSKLTLHTGFGNICLLRHNWVNVDVCSKYASIHLVCMSLCKPVLVVNQDAIACQICNDIIGKDFVIMSLSCFVSPA